MEMITIVVEISDVERDLDKVLTSLFDCNQSWKIIFYFYSIFLTDESNFDYFLGRYQLTIFELSINHEHQIRNN